MAIVLEGGTITGVDAGGMSGVPFATGTRLVFAQAAAPTGWTQVVDDSADNRMLRVVKTAGAGTGGSNSPILNNVVPSHTHGFTTGTISADHSHTFSAGTSGVGDHAHGFPYEMMFQAGGSGPFFTGNQSNIQYGILTSTNGAGAHSHSVSGTTSGVSSNHTHSGSTDNGSSQTNWTPRYIDTIVCNKN